VITYIAYVYMYSSLGDMGQASVRFFKIVFIKLHAAQNSGHRSNYTRQMDIDKLKLKLCYIEWSNIK
jgi:hypothetical protein